MKAEHLEILVEEPSMELFLRALLPRVLGDGVTFEVYPSQGKDDLLRNLPGRLRGYAKFLPRNHRIVVILDRDDDDCRVLKARMEKAAAAAGLPTRTRNRSKWRVANRIAIEELEAWYFGDWDAVVDAYPRAPRGLQNKAGYRDPDEITGTWEAFERVLKKAGYFEMGLSKRELARTLGQLMVPKRNRSRSFNLLIETLTEACQ
ncbi:MAG TPA: DUF4276 family protein [Thermoanaerobaculia bacterium]